MKQKSAVAELLKRLVMMSVHVALEWKIFSVIGNLMCHSAKLPVKTKDVK